MNQNSRKNKLHLTNKKKVIFSSTPYRQVSKMDHYKETCEIPYYFTKLFGYQAIVDNYYNPSEPERKTFRTVELQKYRHHSFLLTLRKTFKVFRFARKIDILFLLSITPETLYKMLAYKLGGGKGKIYVKLDLGIDGYMDQNHDMLVWKNMPFHLKIAHYIFKRLPTIYTVETKAAYNRIKYTYYKDLIENRKLFLMPNCFDPEVLNEHNIVKKTMDKKEHIIITVGRLGTYQKNTELLLEILSKVNLMDWKVYLIGPQTDSFKNTITDFYLKNPNKRSSVFFTGSISQKELYEYYNRSRVFMLTSRGEGFAFVLLEAAYMQNYIIATNVGGVEDILATANGFSVDTKNINLCQKMANELERIINLSDDELNKLVPHGNLDNLTWEATLRNSKAIQKLIQ